jgi:nucleoside-diphosphate-sugar epimerase
MTNNQLNAFFKGKNVLVTGARGFIASNLIRQIAGSDCIIARLYRGDRLSSPKGNAKIEDIIGDLRDPGLLEQAAQKRDIVFHLAGQTSSAWANEHPMEDYAINVAPVVRMIEAFRLQGRRAVFLYAGTATQVGIVEKLPVDEQHQDCPITVYDVHKLASEAYIRCYTKMCVIDGVTLRLSNVYGPGPESKRMDRGIINRMIYKAIHGNDIEVYGTGEYLRDYIYIDDVVDAFLAAAMAHDRVSGQSFVIGSGKGTTIREAAIIITQKVEQLTGRRVRVKLRQPDHPLGSIETRNFVADVSLFSSLTGWKPSCTYGDGIAQTIRHFLDEVSRADIERQCR